MTPSRSRESVPAAPYADAPSFECGHADGERWYAVYAQPHREAIALDHLRQQDFDAFLPRVIATIRHARQTRTILAPLFPRYLFVAFDRDQRRWRAINGTRAVVGLVMQNGSPAPVAKGIVEGLRACSDAQAVIRFQDLHPGQTLRITAGPFAGQLGVLERLKGPERIRVLMHMMSGEAPIELQRDLVVPVRAASR